MGEKLLYRTHLIPAVFSQTSCIVLDTTCSPVVTPLMTAPLTPSRASSDSIDLAVDRACRASFSSSDSF